MGTVHEPKYGPIEIPKTTQPDEPAFLLRGQDALAPVALEAYAGALEAAALAAPYGDGERRRLHDQASTVRNQATAMRLWQQAEPHEVKLPD